MTSQRIGGGTPHETVGIEQLGSDQIRGSHACPELLQSVRSANDFTR